MYHLLKKIHDLRAFSGLVTLVKPEEKRLQKSSLEIIILVGIKNSSFVCTA